MLLISVSPISYRPEDSEEEITNESTEFNTVAHVRQFESIFNYLHVDVHKWGVFQIADNFSLNLRISFLIETPHARCLSHIFSS